MALNPPIRDWKDRRCWIIGGSTGIGAALAGRLAGLGARVAVSARRAGPLEELVALMPAGKGLSLPLDITDAAALGKAAAKLAKQWHGIDLTRRIGTDARAQEGGVEGKIGVRHPGDVEAGAGTTGAGLPRGVPERRLGDERGEGVRERRGVAGGHEAA